jgi:hypothetical protein
MEKEDLKRKGGIIGKGSFTTKGSFATRGIQILKRLHNNDGQPLFTPDQIGLLVQGTAPLHLQNRAEKTLETYVKVQRGPVPRNEVEALYLRRDEYYQFVSMIEPAMLALQHITNTLYAIERKLQHHGIIPEDVEQWHTEVADLAKEMQEEINAIMRAKAEATAESDGGQEPEGMAEEAGAIS